MKGMEQNLKKKDILSLGLQELEAEMSEISEPKFRAKQIFEWLHLKRAVDFSEMTNISKALRTKLEEKFCINKLNIVKKLESSIDNTVKYLYELSDGNFVETVLMEYKHGLSLCVSTQVGCKMGCRFCASAIAGFVRNLTPSEILSQLYATERDTGKKVGGIVLMGIGEPLDNFDNVIKFLQLLSAPEGTNMSLRHVTVSTCGLAPQMDVLAEYGFGLTLSVSLHAVDDASRSELRPVNRSYKRDTLLRACRRYIDKTGRRITFEYAVINGRNSAEENADKLAELLRGINCHVNLIPVNPVKERSYRSSADEVRKFAERLEKRGINATVRRTLGADINAACGQLRRNHAEKAAE